MKAGRLDRRVEVQVFSTTRDDTTGEEIETWTKVFDRWMTKRDVRATERFGADQVVAEIDTVFTGRYRACKTIRPDTHRFFFRGRVYNVLGATELGRLDAVEFACASRGEEGSSV